MKYRTEIDGLRALAVVPVILFHAGFELFSGGYVGVDMFFVISGYLITIILIEDIEEKRFSILNFYERRARRIFPALFLVMLVCIPFAWMWMLPSQMIDFSQSLVAVSFFAANILFWRENGYFAAAAQEKPLLHTWSLAVEQQYYVLFPVFLILAWRFGKNRVFWMIIVMITVSFLLSEWGWRNKATANFYLAPTRAWELLAGSIAAFVVQKQGVQKNNSLSLLGLAAIVFSIFSYDETTPFPSMYALVPVLGVVMVFLYAEEETLVARLLSNRAAVGIGLISYSAYLWHQPLFAFARIRTLEYPSTVLMSVLCLLSVLLAYSSWHFIEKPFRNKALISRTYILSISIIMLGLFSTAGLLGHFNQGFPNRISNELLTTLENIDDDERLVHIGCHLSTTIPQPLPSSCGVNQKNNDIEVLLIGDSHLDAVGRQLLEEFESSGTSAYAISYGGCVPISGLYRADRDKSFQCVDYNEIVRKFAKTHSVKTIVLIGRFPLYLLGEPYNNGEGGVEYGNPAPADLFENVNRQGSTIGFMREVRVAERYRADIELLTRNYNVVVFSPTPEVGWDVPSYYSKLFMFSGNAKKADIVISHSFDNYLERTQKFSNILNSIESDNLHVYDVHKLFCNEENGRCVANYEGNLLYRDDDHLSNFAANVVADDFMRFFEERLVNRLSNE